MKNTITGVVVIVVIIIAYVLIGGDSDFDPAIPAENEILVTDAQELQEMMAAAEVSKTGVLKDVTDGKEVRGLKTTALTTGSAVATYGPKGYALVTGFANLPEPQGDDFYEGWVVRKGLKFSVKSTGKLTHVGAGSYVNQFTSDKDLTDHDFYVLTIEPNDGDPAPADHILEGVMK